MEVHQHVFLERRLAVVDANTIIMSVETVNKCLDRWLVEMTQVGCALSRLLSEHEGLWVNESECINNDLTLDGLNGIDDNCNSSRCQLLKGLLCIDIDGGKPAAKTRM